MEAKFWEEMDEVHVGVVMKTASTRLSAPKLTVDITITIKASPASHPSHLHFILLTLTFSIFVIVR